MASKQKQHYLMENSEGALMLPFMLLFFPDRDSTTATQAAFVQFPMSKEYEAQRVHGAGFPDIEKEERRMLKAHAGNVYDLFEAGMDSPWKGKLDVKEHCGPICLMPASKKHTWRIGMVSFAERSLDSFMDYRDMQVSKDSYEASDMVYTNDPCEFMILYRPDSYWEYRQKKEHERRMETDPEYAKRIEEQEAKTKEWRKWLDDNNIGVLRGGPNEAKVKVTDEEIRLKHREIFGIQPMNEPI